ncbi:molybdopterin cofactor-binding domain-containing protein [Thalassococcus sp. S3]|uniref:xanthine dehydrogenase family protein molybdopterin-binding subunit n=1 Tax=Thalassococcus sp. S3 TaxID=2017482 RepID=UPI001024165F|nr:molybdopterin cofactor-binding domain-containing protein [Thalassococcus sp. S3]QBF31288.1 isoquinoline 1-oxidoreductase [Thalassococcus sp. S3]
MASIGKILRRTFLIGSTAIVGGVAFGAYWVSRPAANPLEPGEGEAALNPFVFVDQQGVTLIAPRAEMGQGVHSTWAALIAEELDVTLENVHVLHGPPAKAYYNSAMIGDALLNKGYDISDFQHNVGEVLGVMGKVVNLQVTGGSTSMKDGFVRMREAGATARETLKEAAAQQWGVNRADLRTEAGKVIAPDGTELTYSELAETASAIDPVRTGLRDAREWRYLGKTTPRIDMVGKATGTAEFGVDVRLPGMKFATVRMNPHLGGGMASYDDTAARAMPGVEQIVDLGNGIAVVATNTWLAMRAAEAVEIDWEASPNPPTTDALFEIIEAAFDADANSALRDDGDVSTLPEGATEVSAEYKLPYLAHATMEPMNATAIYRGDSLEIWCGNQSPTFQQTRCANTAGLENDQVIIHTTLLGGGFGRRAELDFAELATRVAMAVPDTPVQVTWSREEDMQHDYYRPGAMARFRGAVKDGTAVMLDGQVSAQSAVFQAMDRLAGLPPGGPDKVLVEGAFNQPYAIPNYRIRGHVADLNVPVGFWRSVGNSFNGFFHDTFLDEMAHAAGADPLEFRLALMREEHAPSAGCLEAVRDMSGWTGQTPEGVGRGVAFTYSFGTPVAQVIEVVEEDGTIRIAKAWIACDMGIALDPGNIEAQMFGGMMYGLSAACFEETTFTDGAVDQLNFPDYDALRMHTAPAVEVRVLETNPHMGGAGEPGTPPAMPALGNALFDLTGIRARELPLTKTFDLLI